MKSKIQLQTGAGKTASQIVAIHCAWSSVDGIRCSSHTHAKGRTRAQADRYIRNHYPHSQEAA